MTRPEEIEQPLTAGERHHLEAVKGQVRDTLAKGDGVFNIQLDEEDRPIVGRIVRRELEAEGYRVEVDQSRMFVTRGRRP